VPLVHAKLVHPQDTAALLFSLGPPQLADALAPGLDHEEQLFGRGPTARKELCRVRIGLHPRGRWIQAAVHGQLLRVSDSHARQPGLELVIRNWAKRRAHDIEL
jgi:hypothetical protein